jgi:formylglycine-generating enzyme required for sulfatase activity
MGCNIVRTGSPGSYSYSVAGDWPERPVNYVSWGDAARFCNWLHNGQPARAQDPSTTEDGSYCLNGAMTDAELLAVVREPDATWVIPSEDEWYKAAYHYNDGVTGDYWDYPTESDTVPTSEAAPGTDMTNGSANYYAGDYPIGGPYWRAEVAAYDAKPSDSPYGTFDQGGNLNEWNETIVEGSYRVVRGGSFGDNDRALHAARRYSGVQAIGIYQTGFRVAQVP